MRRAVAAPQDPAWLTRCVPYAGRLAERLGRTASANESVVAIANALHHSLQEAARDPLERLALVDSDVLPRQFVAMFERVRALSEGAREGWRAMPLHHDQFGVVPTARTLALRPLPASLRAADGADDGGAGADVLLVMITTTVNIHGVG
jgi:hypothetical protein